MAGGFPFMPATFGDVSGDPLLGFARHVDKDFEVIETERGSVALGAGLILERPGEGRCEERTLLVDILPDGRFEAGASGAPRRW